MEYLDVCYKGATTIILSDTVAVTRGVRQGDLLSPVFFDSILDEAFCSLSNLEPNMGDETVGALGFADDVVLVAKMVNDLRMRT